LRGPIAPQAIDSRTHHADNLPEAIDVGPGGSPQRFLAEYRAILTAERVLMISPQMRAAIFFDRDGVLTEPVFNPATGEYESAHDVRDLRLCDDAIDALRRAQSAGFDLFIVSNQPSYAKGKTTLEAIHQIAQETEARFRAAGVTFREAFYCYHHPQGIVPEFTGPCRCRKPEPYFLLLAAEKHGIDLSASWMVGDRGSDIQCGHRAGCRTIFIDHPHTKPYNDTPSPDHVAQDVAAAVRLIMDDAASRLKNHHGDSTV